jgi:iron complex transport system ATP-binding protein
VSDPGAGRAGGRLEVRELGVRLGRSTILDDVALVVEPGSWAAIVGPNGAGKSTLLKAVAGLVPHAGQIVVDGVDVDRLGPRRRATEIGYAPQVPVMPEAITVHEYVLLGRTPYRPLLAAPAPADRGIVEVAIDRLDLGPLAGRPLRTLSGGERQRAVLARALAQQPRLLLLDEPTSALDLGHAQQVLDLVDRLRAEEGLTVVSTLHDLTLAGQYADHLTLLCGGRVADSGPPTRVLTAQALATYYGARAEVTAGPDGVRVHPLRAAASRAGGAVVSGES